LVLRKYKNFVSLGCVLLQFRTNTQPKSWV
jgi:hypothetical protein